MKIKALVKLCCIAVCGLITLYWIYATVIALSGGADAFVVILSLFGIIAGVVAIESLVTDKKSDRV